MATIYQYYKKHLVEKAANWIPPECRYENSPLPVPPHWSKQMIICTNILIRFHCLWNFFEHTYIFGFKGEIKNVIR